MTHGRLDKKTAELLRVAARFGGTWWATHGPRNRPVAIGCPDILGCKDGRLYALECKRPGEPVSDAQREFMHRLSEAGAVVAVVETTMDVATLLGGREL